MVEVIPLSALPKDTTSELSDVSLHYHFSMLNVNQEAVNISFLSLLV